MSDPSPEEAAKLRGWVQAQAAKLSLEEIRDSVATRYETFFTLVERTSPTQVVSLPGKDSWTAIDALRHFAEWNWQVGEDILHTCLMGERPNNPRPTFPEEMAVLVARSRESLESIWAHVSAADPAGYLDVTWEHPFFGQLNWREWYFFLGVHAIDHTRQLEAASA